MPLIQVFDKQTGQVHHVREEVMSHPDLSAPFTTEQPLDAATRAELAAFDQQVANIAADAASKGKK
jgi:hypothetical protein